MPAQARQQQCTHADGAGGEGGPAQGRPARAGGGGGTMRSEDGGSPIIRAVCDSQVVQGRPVRRSKIGIVNGRVSRAGRREVQVSSGGPLEPVLGPAGRKAAKRRQHHEHNGCCAGRARPRRVPHRAAPLRAATWEQGELGEGCCCRPGAEDERRRSAGCQHEHGGRVAQQFIDAARAVWVAAAAVPAHDMPPCRNPARVLLLEPAHPVDVLALPCTPCTPVLCCRAPHLLLWVSVKKRTPKEPRRGWLSGATATRSERGVRFKTGRLRCTLCAGAAIGVLLQTQTAWMALAAVVRHRASIVFMRVQGSVSKGAVRRSDWVRWVCIVLRQTMGAKLLHKPCCVRKGLLLLVPLCC